MYVSFARHHHAFTQTINQGASMRFQTSRPTSPASVSDRRIQLAGGLGLSAALVLILTGCEKKQAQPAGGPMPVSVVSFAKKIPHPLSHQPWADGRLLRPNPDL
jgi:hypothetical protein